MNSKKRSINLFRYWLLLTISLFWFCLDVLIREMFHDFSNETIIGLKLKVKYERRIKISIVLEKTFPNNLNCLFSSQL